MRYPSVQILLHFNAFDTHRTVEFPARLIAAELATQDIIKVLEAIFRHANVVDGTEWVTRQRPLLRSMSTGDAVTLIGYDGDWLTFHCAGTGWKITGCRVAGVADTTEEAAPSEGEEAAPEAAP